MTNAARRANKKTLLKVEGMQLASTATARADTARTNTARTNPARTNTAKTKSRGPSARQLEAEETAAAGAVIKKTRRSSKKITTSSTAEYFSKNLQQVGFSSPTKAVLTTLKEAMDNSLDACEDHGILPEIWVEVEKVGSGTLRNTDKVRIKVTDNGPGLEASDIPKVFGEYLASSKFGRGRCSRGQQGIGISAATTWAMQTTATGARVETRRQGQRKATACLVQMDLKNNRGMVTNKTQVNWDRPQGTSVEFLLDGRIQLNGEAGLISYLRGNVLLNPHMTLHYLLPDTPPQTIARVSEQVPKVPEATDPHPHTMKLGEFISHARLYGRMKVRVWLRRGFSRISEQTLKDIWKKEKLPTSLLDRYIDTIADSAFRDIFAALQRSSLKAPSTNSVLSVGEDGLALSIQRIGTLDYFAVLTRKPVIADFKPVQIEVAIARLSEKSGNLNEGPVQILRFANRVPLQFDKSACAIVKAINSINWRSYNLKHPKGGLPLGPYIIAVSVVSPFIKFKNASKETIDASDELLEELRKALMQAGQRLSRYLKREHKLGELENRQAHIERFGPILVETLARILNVSETRKAKAEAGLARILESDTKGLKQDLQKADQRLQDYLAEKKERLSGFFADLEDESKGEEAIHEQGAETSETLDPTAADLGGNEMASPAVVAEKTSGQIGRSGKGKTGQQELFSPETNKKSAAKSTKTKASTAKAKKSTPKIKKSGSKDKSKGISKKTKKAVAKNTVSKNIAKPTQRSKSKKQSKSKKSGSRTKK